MTSPSRTSSDPRTVRPRWVWGGTILSLVGLVVLSYGIIVLAWTWSLAGTVVALLGALAAWRGGVLYDVQSSGAKGELEQVVRGTVHEGVAPGDMVPGSPSVQRQAVEADQRRRGLEQAVMTAPRPGPTRPAGWVLLLVTVFLVVSQWGLYPLERPGQTNAVRALGAAILLGFVGLRLATSTGRPPRVAAVVSILVGLALLLNALLADHDVTSTAAAEGVCGALACLAGAAVLLARASRRTAHRGG